MDTPASDFDRNGSDGGFHGATAHAVWVLPGEAARSFVVVG